LTRYAIDAPRPLKWCNRKKVRFEDEVDLCRGWDHGYGVQWGFDGYGEQVKTNDGTYLLDMSRKVLELLDQCKEIVCEVDLKTSRNAASICQKENDLTAFQLDQDITYPQHNYVEVEDDILNVIELYF